MPLIVPKLTAQISQIFAQKLDDVSQIANKISQAYQSYASTAVSPSGAPVALKGSEYRLLEIELKNVMQGQLPPPAAAAGVGRGVQSFWLVPPAIFGPGVATAIVIPAGISAMSAINVADSSQAANSLASALDTMTRTVIVTNPPPLPSGPIL